MDREIDGLRASVYEPDTVPFGMQFRRTVQTVTDSVVVATGGIPTGTGATLRITEGGDNEGDPPDHDPGGDPSNYTD